MQLRLSFERSMHSTGASKRPVLATRPTIVAPLPELGDSEIVLASGHCKIAAELHICLSEGDQAAITDHLHACDHRCE